MGNSQGDMTGPVRLQYFEVLNLAADRWINGIGTCNERVRDVIVVGYSVQLNPVG